MIYAKYRANSEQASSAPQQAVSVRDTLNTSITTISNMHTPSWPFLLLSQHISHKGSANRAGNTLGAATNTVGKGVTGVTDATGNVVAAGGKGLGDAVTGITQGAGDTTKGTLVEEGEDGIVLM